MIKCPLFHHSGHFFVIIKESTKFHSIMNDYEDTILQELMDTPGEIYDLPEMSDDKFDVESYIANSNFDW